MEKINFKNSSEGIKNIVNTNNDEVAGTTIDLEYGMTGKDFIEAINTNMDVYADETMPHISAASTPDKFVELFNISVEGGNELTLTVTVDPTDATIELLEGETAVEGTDGVYAIERGKSYNLTASKTGYDDYTESITAITDINLDIVMTETVEESE